MERALKPHKVTNSIFLGIGGFNAYIFPLRNCAILDSGASIHIFHDKSRFLNLRKAPPGDFVTAGTTEVEILGYGDVVIEVVGSKGPQFMRLTDVAYCSSFACNLVSLRQLKRRGYSWHTDENWLRRADGTRFCKIQDRHGQFVLESRPLRSPLESAFLSSRSTDRRTDSRHSAFNTWTGRKPVDGRALLWHGRLGHPSAEAIAHLTTNTEGTRLRGPASIDCVACGVSKAKRQIRRVPRPPPPHVGHTYAIDFIDLTHDLKGYHSAMLVTDRSSGLIFIYFLKERSHSTITRVLGNTLDILHSHHSVLPKHLEFDGELLDSQEITIFCTARSLTTSPSTPYT